MRIQYCGDTAVLFSNGTCNLNCSYCNIDKNETLLETDKELEDSYNTDYYFNMLKKYYKRGQLKRLETWGGETFLHMERLYPLLHQMIEYFPYFQTVYTSTNFSYNSWVDKVLDTLNQFKDYPLRTFRYQLQLSIDGPEEINDKSRGAGVTARCIANYRRLINRIKYENIPDNLMLIIVLKPTWTLETMKELNDKNKLIEYYKFFEENFVKPLIDLDKSNVIFGGGIPNMAAPAMVTKEDGQIFANVCKLCMDIRKENAIKPFFLFYKSFMPYTYVGFKRDLNLTYKYNNNVCGIGNNSIGFLPNNLISICTEGFTEYSNNYRKYYNAGANDSNKSIEQKEIDDKCLIFTEEEWEKYSDDMAPTCTWMSTARATITAASLQILAAAGQIDSKYLREDEACLGTRLFQHYIPFCVKDNYAITGSRTLDPIGFYRLFFNGAIDYIAVESKWVMDNTEPFDNRS